MRVLNSCSSIGPIVRTSWSNIQDLSWTTRYPVFLVLKNLNIKFYNSILRIVLLDLKLTINCLKSCNTNFSLAIKIVVIGRQYIRGIAIRSEPPFSVAWQIIQKYIIWHLISLRKSIKNIRVDSNKRIPFSKMGSDRILNSNRFQLTVTF